MLTAAGPWCQAHHCAFSRAGSHPHLQLRVPSVPWHIPGTGLEHTRHDPGSGLPGVKGGEPSVLGTAKELPVSLGPQAHRDLQAAWRDKLTFLTPGTPPAPPSWLQQSLPWF